MEQVTGVRSVRPLVTACLGPRTACAGFVPIIWPTTRQSNSMRIAARCCFMVGFANPSAIVKSPVMLSEATIT
jgi:hypothetical protein